MTVLAWFASIVLVSFAVAISSHPSRPWRAVLLAISVALVIHTTVRVTALATFGLF